MSRGAPSCCPSNPSCPPCARAGRIERGICDRLWTAAEDRTLAPRRRPEILEAGLALHPRLAHMLLRAVPLGLGGLACQVAALLGERDILRGPPGWRNADLRLRLDALRGDAEDLGGATVDRAGRQRARLALAYPDRIAQRQPGGERRYRLASGRGAWFPQPDPLAAQEYLVVADLDGEGPWSRIHVAAPFPLEALETLCAGALQEADVIPWDAGAGMVRARRQRRLGELTLRDDPLPDPDPASTASPGRRTCGSGRRGWHSCAAWRARGPGGRTCRMGRWPITSRNGLGLPWPG